MNLHNNKIVIKDPSAAVYNDSAHLVYCEQYNQLGTLSTTHYMAVILPVNYIIKGHTISM